MCTVLPLRCMGNCLCVGMQVDDAETSAFTCI